MLVEQADGISIRPMNRRAATDTKVESVHNIQLYYKDGENLDDVIKDWKRTASRGNVPQALWGEPLTSGGAFMQAPTTPTNDGKDVLEGQLTGFSVAAPAPCPGNTFGKIALAELAGEIVGEGQNPLTVHSTTMAGYPVGLGATPSDLARIKSQGTQDQRQALCALLTGSGLYGGDNQPMTVLADEAAHLFTHQPRHQSQPQSA